MRPRLRSILVADDNVSQRDFIQTVLTEAGYMVSSVDDGRDAIAALELCSFDAIVTDVMMPYRDGFEVLATARRKCPGVGVIMMVGESRASPAFTQKTR